MRLARKAQVLMVVGLVAAVVLHSRPASAAFWEELSDVAFVAEQVCQNGIFFGMAASDEFSYEVFATLDSTNNAPVINGALVTLKPEPVEFENIEGSRSHSGFFVLPWSQTLAVGTSVTFDFRPVGDAQDSADPTVEVEDCFVTLPTNYLPLLSTP